MKKIPMVAGALVLLGVAGFVVSKRSARDTDADAASAASQEPTSNASASATAPAAAGAHERALQRGAHFLYDVTATRAFGKPDENGSSTTIHGTMSFTVVGAAEDGARIRVELASASRADTPKPPSVLATAADLAVPFFVVMRPDGEVSSHYFPRSMPGEARRYLRSIVASMQVVDPRRGSEWETTETDEAGQFVAQYRRQGTALVKTKARYDLVKGAEGLVPVSTIGTYEVRGGTVLSMDPSAWPATADEDVTVVATFKGGKLAMKATTKARLLSSGEARQHIGSFEAAQATFDPDPDAVEQDMALARKNADEGLLKGATLADLARDYESAKESRQRSRAVARMGALFRLQPDAVTEAGKKLLSKDSNEATGSAIASALGSAGTPEAQKVLTDALRSKDVPSSVKNDAAISLGLVDKPTAGGRAALKTASSSSDPDVAETATLALGNAAGQMRKGGDDPAGIVTDLLARLAAATTSTEKILCLDALGNSGDPRALPAIQAVLADPDTGVRAAAVGALRFQKDEGIDPILVAVVSDPDVMVRRAVLLAMAQRDVVALLAGYARVLKTDPEPELRKSAIRLLARSVDHVSEAADLLLWASQNDPDESVKQEATDALSRPPTSK